MNHHAMITHKMFAKIQRIDDTEKLPIYQQVICLTRLRLIELTADQTTKMFDKKLFKNKQNKKESLLFGFTYKLKEISCPHTMSVNRPQFL